MYQVPEEIQSRSGVDTDADRVRGLIIASSFLEVANKPANLRKIGAVASIIGVGQLIFEGATVENADWENQQNWKQYGGGSVEICDQTDVEIDVPIENTKAVSALRAWQGLVYWCANTVFAGLNTTAKTIIGAINEIVDALNDHISSTDNPHGTRFADLLNKEHTHTATEVLNDSTNKTGANVKLVIDDLVNHYQQAIAPTISSTPALKKDDTWLDTTTLIKYAYTADSNNVLNWANVNQCGAEIPNVASGERVVTKSTTGVQVAKTLIDMQIAAGTIAIRKLEYWTGDIYRTARANNL